MNGKSLVEAGAAFQKAGRPLRLTFQAPVPSRGPAPDAEPGVEPNPEPRPGPAAIPGPGPEFFFKKQMIFFRYPAYNQRKFICDLFRTSTMSMRLRFIK